MFKGLNFTFNDMPSERFNLKIGFLGGNGVEDTYSGITQQIEEMKIKKVDKPLFFGVEVTDKINFELLLFSEEEIDLYDRQAIDRWLFQKQYKYFNIDQEDYRGVFFRCIMLKGEKVDIGNVPYAIRVQVVCDSPYVYTDEYEYNYTSPTTFNLTNLSNINDFSFPEFEITMNSSSSVSITNNSYLDSSGSSSPRTTSITGLTSGEVITLDNERGILESSLSISRFGNFNKTLFRLMPDDNEVVLLGDFDLKITIRYRKTI